MDANLSLLPHTDKASRCRVRCADPYQRGRQGAMRGFGLKVAQRVGVSFATLQHELDDAERDVVRKVALRVHALKTCGAAPERITLYLLEILDAMQESIHATDLASLIRAESITHADEGVAEVRAVMAGLTPEARRGLREQLIRNMGNERALVVALGDA